MKSLEFSQSSMMNPTRQNYCMRLYLRDKANYRLLIVLYSKDCNFMELKQDLKTALSYVAVGDKLQLCDGRKYEYSVSISNEFLTIDAKNYIIEKGNDFINMVLSYVSRIVRNMEEETLTVKRENVACLN